MTSDPFKEYRVTKMLVLEWMMKCVYLRIHNMVSIVKTKRATDIIWSNSYTGDSHKKFFVGISYFIVF